MKIVAMIARYLLGAAFLVFGLNKFFLLVRRPLALRASSWPR